MHTLTEKIASLVLTRSALHSADKEATLIEKNRVAAPFRRELEEAVARLLKERDVPAPRSRECSPIGRAGARSPDMIGLEIAGLNVPRGIQRRPGKSKQVNRYPYSDDSERDVLIGTQPASST